MKSEILDVHIILLKVLESGPYKDIAKQLRDRLEGQVEDTRVDFEGNKHGRDLNDYIARIPNGPYLSKLLAINTKSLLKTHIPTLYNRPNSNILCSIRRRTLHGHASQKQIIPIDFYKNYNLAKRTMGHLAEVYCVCYDTTGRFIFTGSDDFLIKIWCTDTYRPLKTLRGHSGALCDMSVNFENTLLASAGMDKIVRIWDLKTTRNIECLSVHTAVITSVRFCPFNGSGNNRYMVSTSNDGSIAIWKYDLKTLKFNLLARIFERNRIRGHITCSSFSTGGAFLACGSSDNCIHLYGFTASNPYHIVELKGHKDSVDSIQFCNRGHRFVTGSKDGMAIIWTHQGGNSFGQVCLNMMAVLDGTVKQEQKKIKQPTVFFVQWSRDDRYIITSTSDHSLKVWCSRTGKLHYVLTEHTAAVYHIESHPTDARIFASAGHDGIVCIWSLETGKLIKSIVVQGERAVIPTQILDLKFSPDGSSLVATDIEGKLSIFKLGYGENDLFASKVPNESFFHTDYAHLIHDLQHFAMDEATHIAPHLLPRPMLVDMNGDPHPNFHQHLVPDYRSGQRPVIPPLTSVQQKEIDETLRGHYQFEQAEFLEAKRPVDNSETEIDSDLTEIDDSWMETVGQRRSLRGQRKYQIRQTPPRQLRPSRPKRMRRS